MIQVFLADDHPIIRQGLRAMLTNHADFTVVGEASTGIEAVQAVEKLRPNVVVVDVMMPDMDGLEAIRQIVARCPNVRIIVLSMISTDECVLEALRLGAAGYLLKSATSDEMLWAIQEVVRGRRVLSPELSERAFDAYLSQSPSIPDPYEVLTLREREILQWVIAGYTSKEIGSQLLLSSRTVEGHRASLMRKLRVRTHRELLRFAESRKDSLYGNADRQ